jgi:triacylglycerol esterase/lipase EstA (alpha/beta hydrolase family)
MTRTTVQAAMSAAAMVAAVVAVVVAVKGGGSSPSRAAATSPAPAPAAPPAPAPAPAAPPAPPPPPTTVDSADCKPPPQHPEPVLLAYGTFGMTDWSLIGPALAQRGYCVFTFGYGFYGTAGIASSARELDTFVDQVLARTGAQRVSIVGHSEGGMMPRYYIKFLGGAAKVGDLVGLSPSNHGTTSPAAMEGAALGCTACAEQEAVGSSFLTQLNRGNETPAGVDYTSIATRDDTVVTPYRSAFLDGPGARVTNVVLQADCPDDSVGHLGVPTDPVALQWVENALGRAGPADPGFRPRC